MVWPGKGEACRKVGVTANLVQILPHRRHDAQVGTKKRALRSNQETDEGKLRRPGQLLDKEHPYKDDPGIKAWLAFMDKYFPDGDKTNNNNIYGYATAQTMVQVLKQCGDDLTRENVMKQAANLRNFSSEVLLPDIRINTGARDFFPIEQMQLMKFDGESWRLFGEVIDGEVGH